MDKKITLKIDGMHCISCSMNIDGELEETNGIIRAETNYAQSKTTILFDQKKIDLKKIQSVIEKLGYTALIEQ